MIIFLVIALILIVVVFGISSVMQSYASAQQAQATIETAQAAQMATMGTILIIVILTLLLMAVIALVVYVITHRSSNQDLPTRNYAGIWKTQKTVKNLRQPRKQIEDDFIVANLTTEQLKDLTDDLLDMIEDKP